jgi:hypothetical protein
MAKKILRHTKKLQILIPILAGLAGLLIGYAVFSPPAQPRHSVVWSYENAAKIPGDLYDYLIEEGRKGCKDYRGTNTVLGTHLASVHQVIDGRYAWIDIGCESLQNTSADFPVVKFEGKWRLISAARYWLNDTEGNRYPRCDVVDEFQISKLFAPTCAEAVTGEDPDVPIKGALRQVQYQ